MQLPVLPSSHTPSLSDQTALSQASGHCYAAADADDDAADPVAVVDDDAAADIAHLAAALAVADVCAAAAVVASAFAAASSRVAGHGVCPVPAAAVAANHSPIAALGPAALGPAALCPAALGPAALGPAALGPAALDPVALGPAAWQRSAGGANRGCAVAVVLMLAGCTADQ